MIFCKLDLSQSELKQTNRISDINRLSDQISAIGSFALSFLNPSDPSTFAFVAIVKMLLYTRYMDLAYPPKLQNILDQQNPNQPSIQFLKDLQDLLKNHLPKISLPERFSHYRLHSNFLVNFLQPLLIILIILVIILILCVINYYCEKEGKVKSLACKALDIFKWNLLISLAVSNYDGIILYSSLQFMSTLNAFNFILYASSYLVALIALLVLVAILAMATYIISSFREIIQQTRASEYNQETYWLQE